MVVDRCESSEYATTCWYQCPLCKQVRLTSDPVTTRASLVGSAWHNDDEGGYAADAEPLFGTGYLLT